MGINLLIATEIKTKEVANNIIILFIYLYSIFIIIIISRILND